MQKIYYGEQTQKALKNFPFSFPKVPSEFIAAIAELKKAAALAHLKAGELDKERCRAIVKACEEIIQGRLAEQFNLPAFQGGAGTSVHMNVNEVLASRATEILSAYGRSPAGRQNVGGKKTPVVHPNDHVNMSQSTNDVIPSAIKLASFRLTKALLDDLEKIIKIFEAKAKTFKNVPKLGRTHMQDAVPTTLGAEFSAYAAVLARDKSRIAAALPYLLQLNLGGTAIGNSINASGAYLKALYQILPKVTRLAFKSNHNLMALTGSQSDFVMLSQALTALTLDASKIANDFKLLASGPRGTLGEITLPELQKGSSIMPGKVNPVLPEAVNQLYFLVSGNNLTIEHAAEGAQLELGVMLPVIMHRLIESLKLSREVLRQFAQKCVRGIRANAGQCRALLEKSTAYATLLAPILGYDTVSDLVKQAVKEDLSLRQVVLKRKLLSNQEFDRIVQKFNQGALK